jgi:hypothetical protein
MIDDHDLAIAAIGRRIGDPAGAGRDRLAARGGGEGEASGMDPGVGNLAGAGEQPALDGKQIVRRPGRGRRVAGARHRSRQLRQPARQLRLEGPCAGQLGEIARLLAEGQSAVGFVKGGLHQAGRSAALVLLEAGEGDPALLKVAAAGTELHDRLAGLAAKRFAAGYLGAHPGGSGADGGQRGGEQGPDVDDIVERSGLDQSQSRRPAGHGLERGGEPDQRALARGEAGALLGAEPLDEGDARLGRGNVRLRRLDS